MAWLRRLGMPLAVIRSVSGLPPARAAVELAAYWATVEAEIAAEEVASHPQRLLLLRALAGDHSSRPDLQLRQARPGDRYLLCSDGLHVVVPPDAISGVLLTVADPDQAAADLLALALDGGAPDNITCIVADINS